ncbi:MAG: hypothetical protein P4L52_03340 [Acidocella sp.]|nr:hypothetical protein [Acidocella sp.]
MLKNDSLFLYKEEETATVAARAICKALGLRIADNLDAMIMEAEIERDRRRAGERDVAMAIRALKALRHAKPRQEQARSKAEQAYDDMVVIMDLISEIGIQMTTSDIVDCCASTLDIPENRVRYALEILALDDKISLEPGGWVIQDENAPADTAS